MNNIRRKTLTKLVNALNELNTALIKDNEISLHNFFKERKITSGNVAAMKKLGYLVNYGSTSKPVYSLDLKEITPYHARKIIECNYNSFKKPELKEISENTDIDKKDKSITNKQEDPLNISLFTLVKALHYKSKNEEYLIKDEVLFTVLKERGYKGELVKTIKHTL